METQTSTPTTSAVGIRFGLLAGLASAIFSFILFVTESDQSAVRWLSLVILIGAMVMAHKAYKQANQGFMGYGEGLVIGTIVGGLSGIITTAFNYVYMTFIDPEYMGRVMELTRMKMEEKEGMTDEQIDQAIAWMQKFSSGGMMIAVGVIGSVLMGLLIALIVSAFTKNAKPEFE